MAMRVHTSMPTSKRNPHVAKKKLQQTPLADAIVSKPFEGLYTVPAIVNHGKPLLVESNVVAMEERAIPSVVAVPAPPVDHVQEDDSVALEAWLEAYSLVQHSASMIPPPIRRGIVYRKDGSVKVVDINKPMVTWLIAGDTWGKGGRPDPEYPTRAEAIRRSGLSKYVRRRDGHSLRKVVDNDSSYKGPHWNAAEMSHFKQPMGFEKWSRPPTLSDIYAMHWACLASHSDYDYEEVHIQTRKKIEGKKYHEWPLGECSVINWKVRDASWWGRTPEESTFKSTEDQAIEEKTYDLLVPIHTKGPVVLAPTEVPEQVHEAANDPVVGDQVVTTEHLNDISAEDFSLYATKYPREALAYSNMAERAQLVQTQLLNAKVSSRGNDISLDKWHYNHWLAERQVYHRTPSAQEYALKRVLREYQMARFFPGMQATNRMAGLRKSYVLKNAYKVIDGVKKLYSKYTPDVTYHTPAYTQSPPVYRVFPRLIHESDELRYEFWWRAIKATEATPKDFLFRSDPVNSVTRIPAKLVNYLCQPKLQITVGKYEEPLLLGYSATPVESKVTYSQQVLLGEVSRRNQNRLSRDYEWFEVTNKAKQLVERLEFVGPPRPIITESEEIKAFVANLKHDVRQPEEAGISDLLYDPTFTTKVLAQMKGEDAFAARVAKRNDLILGGFVADPSSGLMLPDKPRAVSPKEMHEMLHGKKEFGRKRNRFNIIDKIDDFLFGNAAD